MMEELRFVQPTAVGSIFHLLEQIPVRSTFEKKEHLHDRRAQFCFSYVI